jgi:uncharacterized repeat protein (TIGR03803 family)
MKRWGFTRYMLTSCVAGALVAGCGGLPTGSVASRFAQGALPLARSRITSVYSFKGGVDGASPFTGLLFSDGSFYGTTGSGGAYNGYGCDMGCGTFFDVASSGAEQVLYSFKGQPDANGVSGTLVELNGTFYGASLNGGTYNDGTVFAVTPSGAEKVLYSFKGGSDGWSPYGGLVASGRELYGATADGISNCNQSSRFSSCGTVFKVNTSGKEVVLYRFKGAPHDGGEPIGPPIAVNGMFYGTTEIGGDGPCAGGCGTIYAMSASGKERVLHSFKGPPDGQDPQNRLAFANGKLYGAAGGGGNTGNACGSFGCGVIFEASTSGAERIVYRFKGGRSAAAPGGDLLVHGGELYGTAEGGLFCDEPFQYQCGTVFELSLSGRLRVLHRFAGSPDGEFPNGALTFKNGAMYGTTTDGGLHNYGMIYSIPP